METLAIYALKRGLTLTGHPDGSFYVVLPNGTEYSILPYVGQTFETWNYNTKYPRTRRSTNSVKRSLRRLSRGDRK